MGKKYAPAPPEVSSSSNTSMNEKEQIVLDADTWVKMGVIQVNNNNIDESITCFKKAIEMKPDHVEALNNLGLAYSRLNKLEDAASCFQKASETGSKGKPQGVLQAKIAGTRDVQKILQNKPVLLIAEHEQIVNSVRFSPDGRMLATGSGDRTIKIWDVETGMKIQSFLVYDGSVFSVSFSPNGKFIAGGYGDKRARVWDITTGKLMVTLEGHEGGVTSVAFAPDGIHLATGSYDRTARIWNLNTLRPEQVFFGHNDNILSLAFSTDGHFLATGSSDTTIRVWDLRSGKQISTCIGHESAICSVVFAPGKNILASGSDDATVRIWDALTGQQLQKFTGHSFRVNSVAFTPDGLFLASGAVDKTVRIWTMANGKTLHSFMAHDNSIYSVTFSPDGTKLASCSADKTARVWDCTIFWREILDQERKERETVLKMLEFELTNHRLISRTEMVHSLGLDISDAQYFSDLLDKPIDYAKDDVPAIEAIAKDLMKEKSSLNLYEVLNSSKINVTMARKIGKYLVDRNVIPSFQRSAAVLVTEIDNARISSNAGVQNAQKKLPFSAYMGLDPFVFVSYAHNDRDRVYPIIDVLHRNGARIWYDEGIPISEPWKKTITGKILTCASFIIFLSPTSITRPDVLNEIALALDRHGRGEIQVVPVFLDIFSIPDDLSKLFSEIDALIKPDYKNDEFMKKLYEMLLPSVKETRIAGDEIDKMFGDWASNEKHKEGKL
nr:TIR domain-containing protein [Candidatus Sigynarchaeota archaeon]